MRATRADSSSNATAVPASCAPHAVEREPLRALVREPLRALAQGSLRALVQEPLRALWGCSSFDDAATRVNLDLVCTPPLEILLNEFDDQVLGYLTEHSSTFFNKKLIREQVETTYKRTVLKL